MNILQIIKNNPYKLGHLVGFDLLTPMHNDWIKDFVFGSEDCTYLIHRGSYKTSSVSIAIALLLLLRPDKCIMFMRKTDNDIAEIIKRVGQILQTDIWQALAYELYKQEIKLKTFTQTIIDTNLNITNKGTPQLLGIGVNGSLTGKHFDIIFTDDINNIKDRISTAEREHTKLIYQELQNVKNRGGRIINTGTRWHKSDVTNLMPPAKILTCYETGLIQEKDLIKIRESMTPSLFAANYELKCIADENALFTNPNFLQENVDITGGIGHIDAGFGGEDYTAYTYMKYDKPNNKIYAFGKLWHKHVDNCLPEIKQLHEKFKGGTIHVEKNADKGYLHKEIKEFGLLSTVYNEYMNKYVKITTHLYKHWKSIYWIKGTDDDYLNQILDYTEDAEHDDACFVAGTKIKTLFGDKNIEDVKVGDLVYTPFGFRKVLRTHQRQKEVITNLGLTGTFNHKTFNKKLNKFVNLQDLQNYSDCDMLSIRGAIKWKILKQLNLTDKFTKRRESIISQKYHQTKAEKIVSSCIKQYGNFITTWKFLKVITFTIKILMPIITTLAIWLLWKLKNIYHYTQNIICQMKNISKEFINNFVISDHLQQNGINQMRAENGIENTQKKSLNKGLKTAKHKSANFAEKNLSLHNQTKNIVARNVEIEQEQDTDKKLLKNVRFAEKKWNYQNVNTKQNIALQNVRTKQNTKNANKQIVYNITVDDVGCYYANNILVSNCDSAASLCRKIFNGAKIISYNDIVL